MKKTVLSVATALVLALVFFPSGFGRLFGAAEERDFVFAAPGFT